MKINQNILAETIQAYCDCTMENFEQAAKLRNLDYRASEFVSVPEAVEIMDRALNHGTYNNFEAKLLNKLPKDSTIELAREGSVCVYVKTPQKINITTYAKKMQTDEFSIENNGCYRLWWD